MAFSKTFVVVLSVLCVLFHTSIGQENVEPSKGEENKVEQSKVIEINDAGIQKTANEITRDFVMHFLQLVNARGAPPLKILINGVGGYIEDEVTDGRGPGSEIDISRIVEGLEAARKDPKAVPEFLKGFDSVQGSAAVDIYHALDDIANDVYNAALGAKNGTADKGDAKKSDGKKGGNVVEKNAINAANHIVGDLIGHVQELFNDRGAKPMKELMNAVGAYVEDKIYNGGPGLEDDYKRIKSGIKNTVNDPKAVEEFLERFEKLNTTSAQDEVNDALKDIINHVYTAAIDFP